MGKRVKRCFLILVFLIAVSFRGAQFVHAADTFSSMLCTLTCCEEDGSSIIQRIKIRSGGVTALPEIPKKNGYENLGWSLTRGSKTSDKRAGQKIRVTKNLKYYAVRRKKSFTITYYTNDGKKLKTANYSGKAKLLSRSNPEGYTFLGWSAHPHTSSDPLYEAGETITLTKNIKLYEVMFDRSKEPNVDLSFTDVSKKYEKVIFVGDSRTLYMEMVMNRLYGKNNMKNFRFISQAGCGVSWFRQNGYSLLKKELKKIQSTKNKKPVAVIFNFGVNDLRHKEGKEIDVKTVASQYITYWNSIAESLQKQNCTLFYMSVNPINSRMSKTTGLRKEEEVRCLNESLRTRLQGYTYVNTYGWLVRKGYSTDVGKNGMEVGVDDGVHYGDRTYKRILKYCIKAILLA